MKFKTSTVQTVFDSPLGAMMLAASDAGLQGAWFVQGQRHLPDYAGWPVSQQHPVMLQAEDALMRYFCGEPVVFDLPLDLDSGTAFQQTVWRALMRIPRGEVSSYGALSARIGKPAAMRAVGGAVGRNPLSIIVPCHRVLGTDGSLTGYAGGLERKVSLLRIEGASFKPEPLPGASRQSHQQELVL
jgi:methylated-DNA-[protein]-cysteine S-methyltransferase